MDSITTVLARRDRILAPLAAAAAGGLDATSLGAATEAVLRVLPGGVHLGAVFRSLTPLVGLSAGRPEFRIAAWALAGRLADLRNDVPVYPPVLPAAAADVAIQILAARRLSPGSPRFHVRYRGKIQSGPGCPLTFDFAWSSEFIRYVGTRRNGFGFVAPPRGSRPASPGPRYEHYATLVGMRFRASLAVDPETGRSRLSEVRCAASDRQHNCDLSALRSRETFACPFDYEHPCHLCPRGQAACPAAVHPLELVEGVCAACAQTTTLDPYWSTSRCLRCLTQPRARAPGAVP